MTYQPIVPFGGFSGWTFLSRTRETQQEAFDQSATVQRDTDYFAENIGKIETAEQLVADRRLLDVALKAFGLGDDINNKYFIQKVLEDGSIDSDALANKLSDKRYLEFTKAFGFGDFDTPNTVLSSFPEEIVSSYKEKEFEVAVGNQDDNMRLALSIDRELTAIADLTTSDNGKWFTIMGNGPMREVFETALGLPSSFGSLDIDQQLDVFREKTDRLFGDGEITQFADPEKRKDLVRAFLARAEIAQFNTATLTGGAAALTLLQNARLSRGLFG